jgi:hypothetical protein
MNVGLMMLYSLLGPIRGPIVKPKDVREQVDELVKERKVSKQSISNAAIRLEDANLLCREEGYSVNYGYLASVLLHSVINLTQRIEDLEDEVAELRSELTST